MKANEAPKKIYLQLCGDCNQVDCDNCKFEDLEDNVTWCKDKIFDKDIEYTRTDAFIEKACAWIGNNYCAYDSNSHYDKELFIEEFRKYMEGE